MIVDIYYDLTHALLQASLIVVAIRLDCQLEERLLRLIDDARRLGAIIFVLFCSSVMVLKISLDCVILFQLLTQMIKT